MLYWITIKEGKKYHLTSNAGLNDSELLGTFLSLNDLQDCTSRGASILEPGAGNNDYINMRSASQSIVSPTDGDKWTNTSIKVNLAGVQLDVVIRPTGENFYYGGGGGVQLTTRGPDPDGSTAFPGWSWYWVGVVMYVCSGGGNLCPRDASTPPLREFSADMHPPRSRPSHLIHVNSLNGCHPDGRWAARLVRSPASPAGLAYSRAPTAHPEESHAPSLRARGAPLPKSQRDVKLTPKS